MKVFIHIIATFLIITSFRAVANEKLQDSSSIKFLAGVYLINNATGLTEQQKAQRFSQLVRISGVSSDSVLHYISFFYDKPDDWKKIQEKMQALFSEYENNRKNDTISSKTNDNSIKIKAKRSK